MNQSDRDLLESDYEVFKKYLNEISDLVSDTSLPEDLIKLNQFVYTVDKMLYSTCSVSADIVRRASKELDMEARKHYKK